jgi:hypothetical protein
MNTKKAGAALAGALFLGSLGVAQGVTMTPALAAPTATVATADHHHDDSDDNDSWDYRDGYREGYGDGYAAARRDCDRPHGFAYLTQSDRDYTRGYSDGFDEGFDSASHRYCRDH